MTITTFERRGFDLVAASLAAAGVTHVFGLLGDGNLGIVSRATSEHGIQYTASRHDAGAVCMATGYAFATGGLAIATVTHGPGLSNAITALRAAVDLHLPVVVVLGTKSHADRFSAQNIDHEAYVRLTGAGWEEIAETDRIDDRVTAVMDRAVATSHPHVVALPHEVLHGRATVAPPRVVAPSPSAAHGPTPAPGALDEVAAAIRVSRRPVVLAGMGAIASGAEACLEQLAEASGALLATTLRSRGMFATSSYNLGVSGGYSTDVGARLLDDADLVLAFGASLNKWTTSKKTRFPHARIVHVDRDPGAFRRLVHADVEVHADARATAEALNARLDETPRAERVGYRTPEVAEALAAATRDTFFTDASDGGGVDPRAAMLRLDSLLPKDRVVVADGGQALEWPAVYLDVPAPGTFLATVGAGSIGHSLGTAIGAAASGRARVVVCSLGDGSLMMALPELDTAVRARAPLVVIVVNDHAYGIEIHKLRSLGLGGELAAFPEGPDLAAIMRALGGEGVTVHDLADLDALAGRLDALDGPLLIDLRVTRSVVSGRLRSR